MYDYYQFPESIRNKDASSWTTEDKLEWCMWVLYRRTERKEDTAIIEKLIEKLLDRL